MFTKSQWACRRGCWLVSPSRNCCDFLTDTRGKLLAAVHADMTHGIEKVDELYKVDAIFQAEKQFWLRRYGLAK